MEEKKKREPIDIRKIADIIWSRKKLFLIVWIATFVLSCLWILPQPRSYDTKVVLAPESADQSAGGSLGSLASSFGINLGSMAGADAIYPQLYPDVIGSNDFLVSLFGIPVKSIDGELQTDYFTYLSQHQKKSPWDYPIIWIRTFINYIFPSDDVHSKGNSSGVNPFHLTRKEEAVVSKLQNQIQCIVDKKTDVITIRVIDQDPLICATMADSVRARLQDFIINYRTSKARIDVDYYEKLKEEANTDYQKSLQAYSRFCDTHRDVILQSMQSRRDALENDIQMKFNTYNAMCAQLDAAKAKVQERTPAFTILQNSSVPTRPSAPKRMIFVAAMLILATMVTSVLVCRKYLLTFL